MLYGTHGVLYWLLARDVRRFLPVIVCFGWLDLVAGLIYLPIGLHAGMPAWWVWFEGPSLAAVGLLLLVLVRQVPAQ